MDSPENAKSLQDVYKKRLLALFRNPVGTGVPDPSAQQGWAKNRTCGDEVTFHSLAVGDQIAQCWQDTAGCAISTATASLLVNAFAGKTRGECEEILRLIRSAVFEGNVTLPDNDLEILSAVHSLPSRHECVGVALKAAGRSLALEDEQK